MVPSKLPKIISGDGDSPATAIRFEPCDIKTRKAAERRYISENYGEQHVDWSSGIHITFTQGFPELEPSPLEDLFKKPFERNKSDDQSEAPTINFGSDELAESSALISQWNIDLADGTSKQVYFDTSNTIYEE